LHEYKNKFAYMALGGILVVVGMLATSLTTRMNRFGLIECTALRVVDKTGNRQILLSASDEGGQVRIYNKDNVSSAALSADKKGGLFYING